ncbi:site-specific integrase [Parabacteroides sp. AM08-6]|uniref:site-specific integrase n=1 Tax=Parabacteroides sp. AM08-6 TaxID=2292053 RepID=UPI000EFE744F|nr:site-specific integrase [Parabacteroides sp. AM08-6]RHJ80316.1 site-specific integrase [Parabacteroides sp. AM08-6]
MATFKVSQKRVNKKGEAPIYISFYLNREKVEVPTRISIPPTFFDKENGIIKKSYEFASDKNLIISNIKASINDILVCYRLRKENLTTELFWKEYNLPRNRQNFYEFCEEYQRLRFQEVTVATQKKHRSCLNNLKSFQSSLTFDQLTTDLFRRFILFLRNKRGNSEITINKTIRTIAVYINEAVKKEIIKESPIKGLKLRGAMETTAEALNEQELKILVDMYKQHTFSGTTHDVLEFFLFMCFSSLHISDARAIQIDQIGNDEFWYMRGKMVNIRPRVVRVPISDFLREIINHKRKNRTHGQLWEGMIADQKVNEKLKQIASAAGIKKELSAKFGRHTFATIFLRGTKDINTLKEIMGHSNIKQTLIYAHVLDQDRKLGVKVFDYFGN